MAPRPSRFQTTSRSCSFRRAHPNSTARKTSGSSCVRIGCQTGFSNPSTISSTTAATLGTHSLTNPGRLCPSRDATGQQSVTQSEDWYKALETRQEVDWAATASGAADKQGATGGDGSRCFSIVIYNAGCSGSHAQLQPTVERES